MKNVSSQSLYLIGACRPDFIAKGLYAGLKDRNGLPTPLPLTLRPGDEYVNAGFLDGLPCSLIRELEIDELDFHVIHSGSIKASIYLMLQSGEIYHCSDHQLDNLEPGESLLRVPPTALDDPNGCIIYFRIQPVSEEAILQDWFFAAPAPRLKEEVPALTMISRSLGDSPNLVKRYIKLYQEYSELKNRHSHVTFLPVPTLVIYESDHEALETSRSMLNSAMRQQIELRSNPYNLGGGGNMCISIYDGIIKQKDINQFAMIDSDTILPFRTFYLASAKASLLQGATGSRVKVPVVMYSSKPNQVLECGCLFGRGNWGILAATPRQPCIMPLHHGKRLNEKSAHSSLACAGYTDYPPFIFSIFSAKKHQLATHFLPTPFFLRGDDIEMGQHLNRAGIPCEVDGSLLVFQEPKHSLWHEWMAILHGTCLVMAAASAEERCDAGFPELERYFQARLKSHAQIRDLNGLTTYERVLDRLLDLLSWPADELIPRFHDPDYYLKQRDLNSSFTCANLRMVEAFMNRKSNIAAEEFIQLPFVYFEPEYFRLIQPDSPPPARIALVNSSQQTAAILETESIDPAEIQDIRERITEKTKLLFTGDCSDLGQRCLTLTDRDQIIAQYLSQYPITS